MQINLSSPAVAASPQSSDPLTFRVQDDVAGTSRYRVVMLKELAYLPLEAREDPDILGKQWAAIRGLYNGDVNFIYAAAGLYQPQHIGIVQFYGTSAEDCDLDAARRQCRECMHAVEAVLANFVFSRLEDPTAERIAALMQRIRSLPSLLAILGHPDPRLTRKGLGSGHPWAGSEEDLASQQGEIVLRGLAKLREDFVFLVTAQHVERTLLNQALVRMSRATSQYASRQQGALNIGFSLAIPLAAALSSSVQGTDSLSGTESESRSAGWGQGASQAISAGQSTGFGETETQGTSRMQGFATGETHTSGQTAGQGLSATESTSWGGAQSQSESTSRTQGTSDTHTLSHTRGEQTGRALGTTASESTGHTRTTAEGTSRAVTDGRAESVADSVAQSAGRTEATGTGSGQATGQTQSTATQQTATTGTQASMNGNIGVRALGLTAGIGTTGGLTTAEGVGETVAQGASQVQSENRFRSHAETSSETRSRTEGGSISRAQTSGISEIRSQTETRQHSTGTSTVQTEGSSRSWGETEAKGTHDSRTRGDTRSRTFSWQQGQAQTRSQSLAVSETQGFSTVQQTADTTSHTQAQSRQWTESRASTRQQTWSTQESLQKGLSTGWTRGLGRGFAGGFSSGLVPGVHIGRAWHTEDDTAMRLTDVMRRLSALLDRASMEGGFMTSALLFVSEQGRRAAAALVPQAFHGPDVPTPVLTCEGDADLRAQAQVFRPSLVPADSLFAIDILWTRWSTLLTPSMLAAYTAPNLFEEGTALTFQEQMPPLAFYPELAGEAVCGFQISPETGDLTTVPLRLDRPRHFHTVFCGDTGFGKSVAAERLVYETTRHWHLRTVVLDFGTGWRKLLNAPGLERHVEIRQLSPGGVRPLRWNPLQVGRHILPEVQWRTFCDVFGQIAQLGQRRQIHELRDALRRVYLGAGVLTDDPEVQQNDTWGVVRYEEEELVAPLPGTPLTRLSPAQRQILAVHRSRVVGLQELYTQLEESLAARGRRDTVLRTVLEGILFRLHPLVQGAASLQYTAGPDCQDINDIVPGDWGVAVLEGGSFLDDFSKAFLLGWAAWHLYHDAVAQRLQRASSQEAHIQIVFEEANKILAGLQHTGEEGGQSVAEQFEAMWRDSRK